MINQVFTTTFIALSALGIVNSGYLVHQHFKKKHLVCPLNHDCNIVTESKWSRIFFIRNEILGFLFYISMFFSMLALIFNQNLFSVLRIPLLISASFGLLFSIFLVLLQKFIIKDYCFYCLISAFLTLLIFLNSFYLLY